MAMGTEISGLRLRGSGTSFRTTGEASGDTIAVVMGGASVTIGLPLRGDNSLFAAVLVAGAGVGSGVVGADAGSTVSAWLPNGFAGSFALFAAPGRSQALEGCAAGVKNPRESLCELAAGAATISRVFPALLRLSAKLGEN